MASYYTTLELNDVPLTDMRERMWEQYDARVSNVLKPRVRLGVLQRPGSFGEGITSDAIEPAEPPRQEELIAALRAFPELEIAAGEVLYQTISSRATLEGMRSAALELRAVLEQWLDSHG